MKSNQSFRLKVAALITGVLAIGIAFFLLSANSNSTKTSTTSSEDEIAHSFSLNNQPLLGDEDAPVTVVEFGDFKCPACKAWGEEIFPKLQKEYLEKDSVNFSYVNVLFHGEESELSALGAESILKRDPHSYWSFHKALFNAQPTQTHNEKWVTVSKLTEIAGNTTNVDLAQFKQDIEAKSMLSDVERDMSLVEDYHVVSTPTVMINNKVVEDPFNYSEIQKAIEEELEESTS